MSIRKAVAKAIDVLMKKTLKEPAVHIQSTDLYIAKNCGVHSLVVLLSNGESHCYRWQHGRGAEVRMMVANRIAARTTSLTWDHAAAINRDVRTAEQVGSSFIA